MIKACHFSQLTEFTLKQMLWKKWSYSSKNILYMESNFIQGQRLNIVFTAHFMLHKIQHYWEVSRGSCWFQPAEFHSVFLVSGLLPFCSTLAFPPLRWPSHPSNPLSCRCWLDFVTCHLSTKATLLMRAWHRPGRLPAYSVLDSSESQGEGGHELGMEHGEEGLEAGG